ncbi:MAG: hypothetical protein ACI9VR_004933 [Cognaticolwellia sp.]|jgi:hypothetical protein
MPLSLSPSRARLPYSGHLNLKLARGPATLEIAARVAYGLPPEQSWDVVLELQKLLENVDGQDAPSLLESLWRTLASAPETLGPTKGADLSLLAQASDTTGSWLTGCGLSQVADLPQAHQLPKTLGIPSEPPPSLPCTPRDWVGVCWEEGS